MTAWMLIRSPAPSIIYIILTSLVAFDLPFARVLWIHVRPCTTLQYLICRPSQLHPATVVIICRKRGFKREQKQFVEQSSYTVSIH